MTVTHPWTTEPDRLEWRDPETGLPCLIVRAKGTGALCGYVAVPPGHPWHGAHYDTPDVAVHGGLTYAGACRGEPGDVWWLGFDCAHYNDLLPAMHERFPELGAASGVYRDLEYVRGQCARLAAQVHAAGEAMP